MKEVAKGMILLVGFYFLFEKLYIPFSKAVCNFYPFRFEIDIHLYFIKVSIQLNRKYRNMRFL